MSENRKERPYPPRVYPKHGSLYYVDLNKRWHKLVRGLEFTRKADFARAKLLMQEEPIGDNTMETLLRVYLKYCREELLPHGDLAARTVADKEREIHELIGAFGPMSPWRVKPHHVGQYKAVRGKESRVGCNHELATLASAFALGMERGLCEANPARGIRKWRVHPRTAMPTEVAIADFLAWLRTQDDAGEMCAAAFDIAYLTTQRREDVIRIRLDEVQEAAGISFKQRKTGARRLIEWTPRFEGAYQAALAWREKHRHYRTDRGGRFDNEKVAAALAELEALPVTHRVSAWMTRRAGKKCCPACHSTYLYEQRGGTEYRCKACRIITPSAEIATFAALAEPSPVETLAAKYGVTETTLYEWRKQSSKRTRLTSPWLFCTGTGEAYTDKGFQSIWQRLTARYLKATGERIRWHDGTRSRGTSRLKEDGRQARDVTGHTTEAVAERIYDRRKVVRAKAVE
jgi:hypothetical protein